MELILIAFGIAALFVFFMFGFVTLVFYIAKYLDWLYRND